MPWTYRHASREWAAFLDDVADEMGTPSTNVSYTATEGVFRAFRRRLTVEQAIGFAQILPSVPRAIFVQDWRIEPPVPWARLSDYTAEAQALRRDHNLATDNVIEAVSVALHRAVGPETLSRALHDIGPDAVAFWAVAHRAPGELAMKIR
jgi:uncharacterized protein (DUF2267 family)